MAELTLDREYHAKGIQLLCGVDEAGRGPLAGPVFAAAVILPADKEIPGLNDSKKLSEKKREALYDVIRQEALVYCVASASEAEIDELNILGATFLAMHRAVEGLSRAPELVLVDGNQDPRLGLPTETVIKGTDSPRPLRQLPFWRRYPGIGICWNWISSVRNMISKSTRAIPPRSITSG